MSKPKGDKKTQATGKATRRPKQKGKIKGRKETDYIQQVRAMSAEITLAEEIERHLLLSRGCSDAIARNLAKRAGWAKRQEILARR